MLEAKDIDINLFVVFQEIFHERKVSSVAKKMNLSQPAVSNALARLRTLFDDELFVRTSIGMQPTPKAHQLAEPIAAALQQVTNALHKQDAFNSQTSQRTFTLAMTDVGEMYFMPRLIARCQQVAPFIQINSVRANSIDVMAELETGRVDLALGAFDSLSGSLFQRRLFKQNYVALFRRGHPLMKDKMSVKAFLKASYLLVTNKESPYDKINQSLEKIGIVATSQYSVPHFSSVPYILSQSNLVAIVPEKLALGAEQAFQLQWIKPPIKLPSLQTNIFWHRRFAQDDGNIWLREQLSAVFNQA